MPSTSTAAVSVYVHLPPRELLPLELAASVLVLTLSGHSVYVNMMSSWALLGSAKSSSQTALGALRSCWVS